MSDLWTFFCALLDHTVALVTGGALSITVSVWLWLRNQRELAVRTWAAISMMAILVACFQAWSDQRDAFILEHTRVQELERLHEPLLQGTLRTLHLWVDSYQDGRPRVGGVFQAEIVNLGQDSIADRYSIALVVNGKRFPGELLPLPPGTLAVGCSPEATQIVYGKDDLRELTALQPIKKGGKVIGALWAWFGAVDPEVVSGCTNAQIELEAQDVKGRSFGFETRGPPQPAQGPVHLPGLTKQTEATEDLIGRGLPEVTFGPRPVDATPR